MQWNTSGHRFLATVYVSLEAGLIIQTQNSVKKVLSLAALKGPILAVSAAYWMPTSELNSHK